VKHRSAGGCDVAEDPRLDATQVRPQWIGAREPALRVRDAATNATFSVWAIAGRKQLTLRGEALVLETAHLAQRLKVWVDRDVREGATIAASVDFEDDLRARLPAYEAQRALMQGQVWPAQRRAVTRAGLLHLRALQALDGQQCGASHREIAAAIFGADAVQSRWSADGELRAQVRHLLSRANKLVNGGYIELAMSNRKSASTEMSAPGESLPPGFASLS
jgi:hypothetical protein